MEVLISLFLFKAGLLDEETDEANDSQASHSEANSVVPWEASILLNSRGSRLRDSLEEDCTVFVSLVGLVLVLIEVMLVLILSNYGALGVGLIILAEVVVTAMLLGLIALRVSLIPSGLIVFAVVSLVLSGLVLPMRPVLLVQPSITIVLTDLLFVVLLLLVVMAFLLVVFVFVPLSELLSQIHGNLSLHCLKFIALELGPQVKSDLRLQLGIV